MTMKKAFLTVLTSLFGGALLGGLAGLLLGKFLPSYYFSVFPGSQMYDPVQTGLGLGLSQGGIGGTLVGLGLVALMTWREVRLREIESRSARE